MDRTGRLKQSIDALNTRDLMAGTEHFADHVRFHAPGLALELEGRDAVRDRVGAFLQQADAHYDLEEVVEHGPFAVAFVRSTGMVDGQRMSWDLCQVLRYEGDQAVEVWALRGGAPQPTPS